jgi:hypothetical protein
MGSEEREVEGGEVTLREYVEVRPITKKRIQTFKRVIMETLLVFIQTIIPFICGYFFYSTKNLLFLLPILFIMVFNITIREEEVM